MMKTAKETWDKIVETYGPTPDAVLEAMQAYAAEACKEQREICADVYWDYPEFDSKKADVNRAILNAPQPQLL